VSKEAEARGRLGAVVVRGEGAFAGRPLAVASSHGNNLM
jgi:hypothetical protein